MYYKFNFLKELPLLRVLIVFISGLLIAKQVVVFKIILLIACIVMFSIIIISKQLLTNKNLPKKSKQLSIASYLLLFILGIIYLPFKESLQFKKHYSNVVATKNSNIYKLKIDEPPKEKNNSVQLKASILQVLENNKSIHTQGNVIVYLEKNESALALKYGDMLIVKCKLQEIEAAKNPYEFSFKNYQALQDVYHTTYVASKYWKLQSVNDKNYIKNLIFKIQNTFTSILKKYIPDQEALGIALALLIGNKEELGNETIQAYSKSGAMHVLAVSGLHVGIVYLVFNQLLFFLEKPKFKKWKIIILISLIWMYALLTGASASVLRAATMFSLIAIGKNLQQHVNIYNIIAASAWILLLYNPKLLWQVGFQLSYLAVIGILLLHKKIYGLFVSKNNFIDKIWNLSAVSIAAQIATLPLGLYYFHLFPNYFLIANLFVIPLATIIVYMGVALLAVSKITLLAKYLGIILSKTILLLNWAIEQVNSIPGSTSEGWHLTTLEVLLLYLFIILLFFALHAANKISLILAFFSFLLIMISYNYTYFKNYQNKYLIVYHISKETAIEFQDGFHITSLYSNGIQFKNDLFTQHIQNYWYAKKIKKHKTLNVANENKLYNFADKTILIVDSIHQNFQSDVTFDYVIIKNQQKMYFASFCKKIKAKQYIFDASNKPYQLKYWKKDCESLQENCYFVQEQSAFIQKLH